MYDLVPHNRAVGPASRCFLVISRASMCRFDDVDKFPHCVVCGTSQLLSRSLLLSFFISLPASIPPSSSPICPPIPPTRPGGMREAIEYLYIYIYQDTPHYNTTDKRTPFGIKSYLLLEHNAYEWSGHGLAWIGIANVIMKTTSQRRDRALYRIARCS